MDILIKSYYRPYLLDRCLNSIKKNVKGYNNIVILDDGTPPEYLAKLQERHPEILIRKSPYYEEKVQKIKNHLNGTEKYQNSRIPMTFWYEQVESVDSEYVLLTEDDVWFTAPIDLQYYTDEMQDYQIDLLKLGYNGKKFKDFDNHFLTDKISFHNPKIIIPSSKFYGLLLNNSFNIRTYLEKYNLIHRKWRRQLYLMYNIAMALYKKDYLLMLLSDKFDRVQENLQLKNAVKWHLSHTNKKNKFSYLNEEVMRTTHFSSASFNNHRNFDLLWFNSELNKLWLEGDFDVNENYPDSFSDKYIKTLCSKINLDYQIWKKWNIDFFNSFGNG